MLPSINKVDYYYYYYFCQCPQYVLRRKGKFCYLCQDLCLALLSGIIQSSRGFFNFYLGLKNKGNFKDNYGIIRIYHECPCRIGKFILVEIHIPGMRFPCPTWTSAWWILFLPPLSGLFLLITWSCETEVSHMRKMSSYRQRWEKIISLFLHKNLQCGYSSEVPH